MKNIVVFDYNRRGEEQAFATVLRTCRNLDVHVERVRSDMLDIGGLRFLFLHPHERNLYTFFRKHKDISLFFLREGQMAYLDEHREAVEAALDSKDDIVVYHDFEPILAQVPGYSNLSSQRPQKSTLPISPIG